MAAEELGEFHNAKVIINSINFAEVRELQLKDDWKKISSIICKAAKSLEAADADCILLAANTMHLVANDVEEAVNIPLIHIAKETAREIKNAGIDTVALLGTRYTMQLDFFKDTLSQYGIETLIPKSDAVENINAAIYDELAKGLLLDPTKKMFLDTIDLLAGLGADGIVLGCTEIPMLIKTQDCPLPMFDTTKIHARAAFDFMLGKENKSLT